MLSEKYIELETSAARDCELGRFEEAVQKFSECAAIDPTNHRSFANRAYALKRLGHYEDATSDYQHALTLNPQDPELNWNYALISLLLKNFETGFTYYEKRMLWPKLPGKPIPMPVPRWNPSGEPDEIVVVQAEQGFGDTLQFARWIPELITRCKKLYFQVPPELMGLFEVQHWNCTIVSSSTIPQDASRYLHIMSVPQVLGLSKEKDFQSEAYLKAVPTVVPTKSQNLKIGLVWKGRPTHGGDARRSLQLKALMPLFEITGIEWFHLNAQDLSEEIQDAGLQDVIQTPVNRDSTFLDTAQIIAALDLVICVDTSVAHLAGALGKPVWLMLPHQPDWRWGLESSKSYWYPNTTLFRCPSDLAWKPIIQNLQKELETMMNKAHTIPPFELHPRAHRGVNIALNFERGVVLKEEVLLESPFKAWQCNLLNFKGGAFSYVAPGARLYHTEIGRYCSIGDGVAILSEHPTQGLTTSPFFYETLFSAPFDDPPYEEHPRLKQTTIGNDVWIGAGVRIKTGVTIGDGVIVGAGSVVTKNIPPYTIVGGVPARIIRNRYSAALAERISKVKWWQYDLLGLGIPMSDPERALDIIESCVKNGNEQFTPHNPGFCKVWIQDEQILAELLKGPGSSP